MVTPDATARLAAWAGSLVRTRSRGNVKVGERAYAAITERVMTAATLLALVLVATFVVGPMLGAELGPIDDHQIPQLLAEHGGTLEWSEVPRAIASHSIEANRFRPLYWAVRVAETAAWGAWAPGWYVDRLALLILTLLAGFALARRFTTPALAALVSAAAVIGPQAEAWFRLGPQEAIAIPLFLGGLALVVRGRASGLLLLAVPSIALASTSWVLLERPVLTGRAPRRSAQNEGLAVGSGTHQGHAHGDLEADRDAGIAGGPGRRSGIRA